MIRHVVLVRFREAVPAAEIAAIFKQLDDLRAKLPGMKIFCCGSNVSPEGLARGFSHAFTVQAPSRFSATLSRPASSPAIACSTC